MYDRQVARLLLVLTTKRGCLLGHSNLTCQDGTLNFPPQTALLSGPPYLSKWQYNSPLAPKLRVLLDSSGSLMRHISFTSQAPCCSPLHPPNLCKASQSHSPHVSECSSPWPLHNQKFSCLFTHLYLYGVYLVKMVESRM